MGQELSLARVEENLDLLGPKFAQVLAPFAGLPMQRLTRTVMVSIEKTPKLLECTMPSIMSAAMTAACVGLEVDGVTGQGYIIPYAGKAQFQPGYKGYNTQAGRSGYGINSGIVREGDTFDYQLGTGGYIRHKPILGNEGPILGFWALASSKHGPDLISQPLSLREIVAVMAKSPGAKMKDSPWNDKIIGFPAMGEKTAKRRLARQMPLNLMVVTAAIEEAFEERALHSMIRPGDAEGQGNSLIIEGQLQPTGEKVVGEAVLSKPDYVIHTAKGVAYPFKSAEEYLGAIRQGLDRVMADQGISEFLQRNQTVLDKLKTTDRKAHDEAMRSIQRRRNELSSQQ